MEILEKSPNYYGYPKNKEWYAVQFDFHNPTSSPYVIDLFNGYGFTPFYTTPSIIESPSVVSASISPISKSSFFALNTSNNVMYVSSGIGSTVTLIDCNTDLILSTISVGSNPQEMAYNQVNNCIYVANGSTNNVSVIDCSLNLVIATISVGSNPIGISYNTFNDAMYVTNGTSNDIYIIDCATNTVVGSPIIIAGGQMQSISYNSNSNQMYVCSFAGGGGVYVVDCATNTVVGSPIIISSATLIEYNYINNTMYVSNFSNNVYVVDCATNTVVGSPIIIGSGSSGMAFDYQGNKIYANSFSSNEVYVIDCLTNSLFGLPISVGASPLGIIYNSSINKIYVANYIGDSVSIISSAISPRFYITGTTNYNQFVTELNNIPKRARHIRLIVESSNQLAVPLNILKRDANGNFCNVPKIPTEYRNANNYQGSICDMPFEPKELILNNQMIISQYIIAPNSTVKMVLYFDEIDMSDLLSEKLNVYNQIETKVEDLNTISEATLERRYENRPTIKPSWLKNFKSGKVIKI